MFDKLLENIQEWMSNWIKELLAPMLQYNLENAFNGLAQTASDAGAEIALSPQEWNPTVWQFVLDMSEKAIIPIATMILAYVLCYELYALTSNRNSQYEVTLPDLMKVIFKIGIALFLVQNCTKLILGMFDVVAFAIRQTLDVISLDATTNIADIDAIMAQLMEQDLSNFLQIFFFVAINGFTMAVLKICIQVALVGRMIQIYIYSVSAPIPIATLTSDSLDVGKNFIKGLCSVGLQGVLMLFILGIYSALVMGLASNGDMDWLLLKMLAYSIALGISLFKTSAWANSIMNTH